MQGQKSLICQLCSLKCFPLKFVIDMYMTLLAQKEVCLKFTKTNKRKKLEKELCMIKTINFSVYSPVIIHKLFFVLNAVLGQAAGQPVGGPSCSLDTVQDFLIMLGIKPCMHLWEISIFSLNNVIVRPIKIMNRADKNWAHFQKTKYSKNQSFQTISFIKLL